MARGPRPRYAGQVPVPTIIALLVALLVGNLLLIAALASRRPAADRSAEAAMPVSGEPVELAIEMARDPDGRPASGAGIRLATYDRVIRIVSYTFFLVTAVVVAASGLWPDSAPAIYLLLLAGAAAVFVLHEVAPRVADVESLFLIEGAAGVTFFTLLVMLTGGVASPFFFGYFLVVAAAALVTGGGASLVLAAVITAAYLGGLLVTRAGSPYTSEEIVVVAVNVMALWLLSYLASVVAGEQRRTRDAALRLSLHDPLTRLFNRTFLFAVIEREIARAGRTNRGFTVLMLDLDDLKPVNDRFGHQWGDRLLRAVAETVRRTIRFTDAAARYGGDEFVVLLPETDAEGGYVVGEKLRRDIAALKLHAADRVRASRVSVGLVNYPGRRYDDRALVAVPTGHVRGQAAWQEPHRRVPDAPGTRGHCRRWARDRRHARASGGGSCPSGRCAGAGGDPAPWGPPAGRSGGEPPLAGATCSHSSSRRMRASLRRPRDRPARGPAAAGTTNHPARGPSPPTRHPPRARPPSPTRRRSASPLQRRVHPRPSPWLTRTDDSLVRPAPSPIRPRPCASDHETRSERWMRHISRPDDRPWIVLPIEPDDPPDKPLV